MQENKQKETGMNGLLQTPRRPTRLTLRSKTLLLISLMLVGVLATLYFLSRAILLGSFADLEREEVERNVQRTTSFLDTQVHALDNLAFSWAHRPDTAAFVSDPSETYIEQTLNDGAFEALGLNLFLAIDSNGHFVFAKTYNLISELAPGTTGGFVVPPAMVELYLKSRGTGLDFSAGARYHSGVLLLDEGTMLVAIQPVPGENGPAGTLVMGRMLGDRIIDYLAASMRVGLSFKSQAAASPLPDDFARASQHLAGSRAIYTSVLDEKNAAGYTLIPDITGESALILRVDMPRDIYREGQDALAYFEAVLIGSGILFALMSLFTLEGLVLRRLLRLSAAVRHIGWAGDPSRRVPVYGHDELAALAEGINTMLGSVQDSQTRLAESRQQLHQVITSINDCLYTADLGPDGQVLTHTILSPQLANLTGYPLERFTSDFDFWRTLIHPDDLPPAAEYYNNLLNSRHSEAEYRITRADNSVIWVRDSLHIRLDPESGAATVYGVISDITARKVIEHALRDANDVLERRVIERTRELAAERNLLKTIIDTSTAAIFVKDAEARLVMANQRLLQFLGAQSLEDVRGTTDFDYYAPDLAQQYFDDDMQVIRTGEPLLNREEPSIIGDHKAWALTTKVPLRDEEGRVTGLIGVGIDITERKRIEEELRATRDALTAERNLLRTVIDSAVDGIYAKDTQGRFVIINTYLANYMSGKDRDEALGKTDFDFYPPDLAQQYWDDDMHVIQTGQPIVGREEPTLQGTETRWIMTTKVPLRDLQGQIIGLVGMGRDITERKQMEEALIKARDELEQRVQERTAELSAANARLETEIAERRRAEEALATDRNLLRTLIDTVPDALYAKDAEGRVLICNQSDAQIRGAKSPDDAVGKTDFDFYPPDIAERYWADDLTVLQTGQPLIDREEYNWLQNGVQRWALTTKVPVRDSSGQVVGLAGVGRDITTRRQIEAERGQLLEQMRVRANELATVAQVSRQVTTILDMDPLLQTVVDLVRHNFDFYNVQVFLCDNAAAELVMVADNSDMGPFLMKSGMIRIPMAFEGSVVARAAHTREIVIVNNLLESGNFLPNPLLPHTRSEAAIPMIVGDNLVGVLNIEDDKVDRFSSDDNAVLATLAAQVAIAIENARRFTESARQLAIIENSNSLIGMAPYSSHSDILVTYVNPAGLRVLGYSSLDEIRGRPLREFFPPEVARTLREAALPAALAEGQWHGETEVLHRSGRRIPVDQTIFVIRNESGQPRDIATIMTDITARKEAQKALEASEIRFRSLFETMTEGCALHDLVYDEDGTPVDYVILDANPAYKTHTGLDPREVISQRGSEIYGTDDPPYFEQFSGVAISGEPVRFETYFGPMGRHFQISIFAPGPGQFATIFTDITERKKAEQALAESERTALAFQDKLKALHELNITLSKVSSLDDLYARAIELGCRDLGFERLGLWLLADDGETMMGTFGIDQHGNLADERDLHHPVSEDPWSEAALRSKSRLAIWQDKDLVDRLEPVGRGTNMIAAMWDGDRTIGWLAADNLLSGNPMAPYSPELLVLYGATIGRLITLKRAQDALRQSQERLELALSASQQGLWDWNIKTGETLMDERWATMLGYTLDEIAPHVSSWENLVHPDDMPGVQIVLNAHLEGRTPLYEVEHRMRARSGEWRWILDRGKVVSRDAEGRPLRAIGAHLDITERKEAEEALRRANRAYRTLSDCNQSMVRANDEDRLLSEICTILVRQGGYQMAWVGYIDPDHPERVRVVAQAGDETGYLAARAHDSNLPPGYMPTSRAIRSGEPYQARDLRAEQPDLGWFDTAIAHGYQALTTLPLLSDGETLGTLSVYTATAGAFDDQEIALLQELASDLAFGITVLRTRAERARAEDQLRQLVAAEHIQRVMAEALSDTAAAINSTLDLDRVLDLFLENVARVVPYSAANVMLIENTVVRVVCHRGYETYGMEQWINTLVFQPEDFPNWKQLLLPQARPYVIPDTRSYAEWKHYPESEWILSSVKVPIFLDDTLIGILNLDADTPDAFTQEQADRLQAFAHQAANAIHNARLFSAAAQHTAALQTQAQRLALVNRVSTRLAQTLDLQEIYDITLREVQAALGAQYAGLVVYENDEAGRLVLDTHPTYRADTDRVIPLKDNRSIELIRRTQKTVVAADVLTDPNFDQVWDVLRERGTRTLMVAPLIVGDELIGTLGLDWTEPRTFSPEEIELAETIASQASVAIAKARLYDAEREQRILAQALSDTASAINSTLDPESVLNFILANVGRAIPHDAANIMMIENGVARVVRTQGYTDPAMIAWIDRMNFVVDEVPTIRRLVNSRRAYAIPDTTQDPNWISYPESQWVRSLVSAPIRVGTDIIGVLNLDSTTPGAFGPEDAERLQTFAEQAAVAMHNARLFTAEREQRILAEVLQDTAAALTGTLDFDAVLHRILENVGRVVPHDAANIMAIDWDTRTARVIGSQGYEAFGIAGWIRSVQISVDDPGYYIHDAIQSSAPRVIADAHADPRRPNVPETLWIGSFISVPIMLSGQVVALLNLDSATRGFFTPAHTQRLHMFANQVANAIQNAQLFQAEQEQRALAEAMRDTAATANHTPDPDVVMSAILTNVQRVVPCDAVNMMMVENGVARVVQAQGYAAQGADKWILAQRFILDERPISQAMLESGGPVVVANTVQNEDWQRTHRPEEAWIRSMVKAPIYLDDKLVGILHADSATPGAFGPKDAERLKAFADQAANAIRNTQLFRSEQEQRALAEALRDNAETINSTLDSGEVLDRLLDNLGRVVLHDAANVMLIEDGIAYIAHGHGYAERGLGEWIEALRFVVGQVPIWQRMVQSRQPFVISRTAQDADWQKLVGPEEAWIQSTVKAPIYLDDELVGILHADSATPGTFGPKDAERLKAFADQAAIALRNARLFEATQQHAADLEQKVYARTLELDRERARLQAILDSMGEGVLFSSSSQVDYVNPAMINLLGYSFDELVGTRVIEAPYLIPGTDTSVISAEVREKKNWHGETRVRRKDGAERDVAITVSQVYSNDESGPLGAVAILRDISQEKALHEQRARFIGRASHELRTPLANMKTRLYLVRKQPDQIERHLGVLERVTDSMTELVESLLDISRFERGAIELHRQQVQLQDVINDVVAIQRPEAQKKQIELAAALPTAPLRAYVDPQRIAQVITNLVTNAIHYTPEGGRIMVGLDETCEHDTRLAVLRVQDTGIGMDPETVEKVFEPFFRAAPTFSPGTGLGLTIAREIVHLHGGEIGVTSVLEEGSTFFVKLELLESE